MNRVNRILISFIILISFSNCFSQDFELRVTPFIKSKIIYKDSTINIGLIRMAGSVFKPRFKKEEKVKERKIDYELIEKIIIYPETDKERVFQYLNNNYNKFEIFVELIYTDVISIFINLSDPDDLFYSDFNRQSISEALNQTRFENSTWFKTKLKKSDTLHLPNGEKITLPIRYTYYRGLSYGAAFGTAPKFNYYLLKDGNPKLYRVEKNKRFLKNAEELIKDCPIILKDIKEDKIIVSDIPSFIEYYKEVCLDNKFEN